MSSAEIRRRLAALEVERPAADGLRIRRVVIEPASTGPVQAPIAGWQCGEIVTRRRDGESEAACWDRHAAALDSAHGRHAVTTSIQLTEGGA